MHYELESEANPIKLQQLHVEEPKNISQLKIPEKKFRFVTPCRDKQNFIEYEMGTTSFQVAVTPARDEM